MRVADQHGRHRQSVGDALGQRRQVGRDAEVAGRQRPAEPSHARLNLVVDQQRARFVAACAQCPQELAAELHDAGNALNGLQDDRRNGVVDLSDILDMVGPQADRVATAAVQRES